MSRNIVPGVRSDVQPLVEEVVDVIRRHVPEGPLRVWLFGSWAQGRALNVSDLNIALDTGGPVNFGLLTDIVFAVEDLPAVRKIEIMDLHMREHAFRQGVLKQGELLYAR